MNLAALFPNEDYQFAMRFERGRPEDFFAPTEAGPRMLAERERWLNEDSARYAAMRPGGEPLLEETLELLRTWPATRALASSATGFQPVRRASCPRSQEGLEAPATGLKPVLLSGDSPASASEGETPAMTAGTAAPLQPQTEVAPDVTPLARCIEIGRRLEPDFLLLKPDAADVFRLLAGCVCFPSSWSLEEKMGRPLEEIHSVVPGLNTQLSHPISGFLGKMAPGVSWLRANWGLSRSAELNQHPARKLPRLDPSVGVDEVWLRVEWQSLVALPANHGVLFGMRIEVFSLAQVKEDRSVADGLQRALRTMPEAMAAYKGIASARERIVMFLDA